MKNSHKWLMAGLSVVVLLGAGCTKIAANKTGQDVPAGPQPAKFDDLSPADAAKKATLTASSVVLLQQHFSGSGAGYAAQAGWSNDPTREVVVERFAPGNEASVAWKTQMDVKTKSGSTESKQVVGTLRGANLKDGRELTLPAFWGEGDRSPMGTALIWISADDYENLTKSKSTTLYPGLTKTDLAKQINLPAGAVSAISAFAKEVESVLVRKDVYVTDAAKDLETMDLKVNGKDVKVEVIRATNWFGTFLILNNPQNPLILQFTGSDNLKKSKVDGLFDYKVTELKDLQE
jgi:hypothetical protein